MSIPHILIVDDDPALLQALPEALRLRMGEVMVDTADSAPAALDCIMATDYDAVVSDIKMPGMDGLVLLARIHQLRPGTPTLLITGHGEHDLAVQALRGGAYDFIQKPIDRDYFVASLSRAVQMRQLSREVEAQRLALERYASSLEQAVVERTRELVEANRAKDEFLSIASHELRTPLTTLKGLTQFTRRQVERAGTPITMQLIGMERAIERMEMLVNDLLDASRIESGKLALRLEQCDLTALCQQAIDEQAAITDRVITFEAPEAPCEVEVDVNRIGQVLANLLANALKYSSPGSPVALSLQRAGDEAIISVRDRGTGIPADELGHIFDRFYRAPSVPLQSGSSMGLGLGLYISREIMERHGGRVWAESTPGSGSVFFLVLPLAAQSVCVNSPYGYDAFTHSDALRRRSEERLPPT